MKFVPGVPKNLYQKVNTFIIYLPLPAITLIYIPKLELTTEALIPVLSAWYIYALAIPFFYVLKRIFNWSTEMFASLVLVCGLGNTAFIGYPIISLLYGETSLQYAILVDQSTFVILATVGVIWATAFAHGKPNVKQIVLRLVKFPPFLAFIAAFFIPAQALVPVEPALDFFGSLMVPLAIFSVGMQFKFLVREINYEAFYTGLFYKLLFAPALLFVLLFWLGSKSGLLYDVTFIECAMPPMITASIIANQYNLEGDLANALVTYGIPVSFASLWMWSAIL
ncbi:MAG: AEC family transporter [Bacteroidetes bacterium]|nr:AEC family transporter [Bacteroidota bacterium]